MTSNFAPKLSDAPKELIDEVFHRIDAGKDGGPKFSLRDAARMIWLKTEVVNSDGEVLKEGIRVSHIAVRKQYLKWKDEGNGAPAAEESAKGMGWKHTVPKSATKRKSRKKVNKPLTIDQSVNHPEVNTEKTVNLKASPYVEPTEFSFFPPSRPRLVETVETYTNLVCPNCRSDNIVAPLDGAFIVCSSCGFDQKSSRSFAGRLAVGLEPQIVSINSHIRALEDGLDDVKKMILREVVPFEPPKPSCPKCGASSYVVKNGKKGKKGRYQAWWCRPQIGGCNHMWGVRY